MRAVAIQPAYAKATARPVEGTQPRRSSQSEGGLDCFVASLRDSSQ